MARQVAHEIKNPLTPIQLSAEHLQRVHEDQGRPLGAVFDQCLRTILGQVRLLRQIASEFSNFAAESTPRPEAVALAPLLESIVESVPARPRRADRVFSPHARRSAGRLGRPHVPVAGADQPRRERRAGDAE